MAEPRSSEPSRFVLAVDAGGSKTVALVQSAVSAADGPIGRGKAGAGNIAEGTRLALPAIEAAIDAARADAGCRAGPFAAVCLAVAGSGTEEGRVALETWARHRQLADEILIVHDAYPVLACAAPEGPGLAIVAGTGAMAFARNARGETARAGGWGWLAGEEGSGHGIALAALRAIASAADGRGPRTKLSAAFFELFRVHDVRSVLGALYQSGATPTRVASLATLVSAAAEDKDEVALQILADAAAYLASLAAVVIQRLGLQNSPCPLGLAGGVLLHSNIVREQLKSQLAHRGVPTSQTVLVEAPALGALRLAQLSLRQS